MVATIFCTGYAQILQKRAALEIHQLTYRSMFNPAICQSVILLTIGMAFWLLVLQKLDVSLAYPLLSVNYILIPLLARWQFGEELTRHRIAGSIIIVAGLSLMFAG